MVVKKEFFLLAAVVLGVVGLAWMAKGIFDEGIAGGNRWVTVTVSASGFRPRAVTVNEGDTVAFRTVSGERFWPASDLHPLHLLYPEFDPKKPIDPGDRWQFVFTRVGTWYYHDHVNPTMRGVIRVLSKEKRERRITRGERAAGADTNKNSASQKTCQKREDSDGDPQVCWEEFFGGVVRQKGVEPAFALLLSLRPGSGELTAKCHVFAHRIGEEAFWLYIKTRRLPASSHIPLCGYGFFHGFMQEFVSHGGGSPKEAVSMCQAIRVGKITGVRVEEQCYHGIGHGIIFSLFPDYQNDPEALTQRGLEECKRWLPDELECFNGIFGGMVALAFGHHGYSLAPNRDDPFWLCQQQEARYQLSCYDQFVPVVFGLERRDIRAAAAHLRQIGDDTITRYTMEHLGSMLLYGGIFTIDNPGTSLQEMKALCAHVGGPHDFAEYCLRGFVKALVGSVEEERLPNFLGTFCKAAPHIPNEEEACADAFAKQVYYAYGLTKGDELCQLMGGIYEGVCREVRGRFENQL